MAKTLSSLIALFLLLTIPTRAEESQSTQPSAPNAKSNTACRSKCDTQYPDCTSGTAPMHSVCDMYKSCVNDCD